MNKKDNKDKEIKGEVSNRISSSGNVKVTLIKNGKKIGKISTHNTGTINLCDYMISALVGDYVSARRPGWIIPFYRDGKTIREIGNGSGLSNVKVGATSEYWKTHPVDDEGHDGGFCTADLTFLIPSWIVSGSTIDGFLLFSESLDKNSDNRHTLYAQCDLPTQLIIEGDTSLKVEWTLYVSYKWNIERQLNK